MIPLGVFGINSDGLNLAVNLLILVLVVVWLALLYWTYADARRRIADPMLIGCATAASLFPFVGTIIYMIVRPPEYLDDVRERELEMQAAEARLHQLDFQLCPHCDHTIERDFLRCPSCLRKLKDPCPNCSRPLKPEWQVCPFCEAEVAKAPAPRRRRKTGTTTESSAVAPDAFARGLSGEIIARFERKGLRIVALKHMTVTEDLARQHYAEHDGKPFFGELVEFITSGPIVAMVLEGQEAIKAARQVIGATNPLEATTGSIRGDFAVKVGQNMVHGSDAPESGQREAGLFFPEL